MYSPEYGHSSGGQFNTIVKSGTNEFHGSIYEYFRNRNLDALDQSFARQGIYSNPRYDQNRLGATFGGPIKRNKLFFFTNFEYNPIGQASTPGATVYAPTSAGFSQLAAIPGVIPTDLDMLKQYAVAAAPSGDTITVSGKRSQSASSRSRRRTISTTTTALARWITTSRTVTRFVADYLQQADIDRYARATLPAFFTTVPVTNYLATIAEYHSFSPTFVNELRLGYNRNNQDFPAGDFSFTRSGCSSRNLTFDELNLQLGPDPNAPQFGIQNLYQGTDNVTWTKGSHTFKFGTEFRKYIAPQSFTQRARGDYEWQTLPATCSTKQPDFAQRTLGNVIYYGDQIASYNYAQDTWRMRPNFTVNLGARYEYTTVPYSMRSQTLNQVASVPGVLEFGEPHYSKTTGLLASASRTRLARVATPPSARGSAWHTMSCSITSGSLRCRRS